MVPSELSMLESCEGCGACCEVVAVPPFRRDAMVDEMVEKRVPEDLVKEIDSLWEVRLQLPTRPCLWYDESTQRCQHYELRPQACRDFEINSPSCHACREQQGISNRQC